MAIWRAELLATMNPYELRKKKIIGNNHEHPAFGKRAIYGIDHDIHKSSNSSEKV